MKTTNEFLNVLIENPNKILEFEYTEGKFARKDYHLTEFKNVTFDTVDCGGVANKWEETHIQIWENEEFEANHSVDTTKALKIFEIVEKTRPTFKETEIKFEYGNAEFHTAVMGIKGIAIHADKVVVKLFNENTTCKAKDRATTKEEKEAACCAPASGCC
ncbi:hypothetical protein UJ101_00587 [Flavobacteriaceae bacterium UJ101]|nr:hypothetical protein UJ101_00587 [Flavobacteriaceae bacterium UJ101]